MFYLFFLCFYTVLFKARFAQEQYQYYRDYQNELNTVCSNVNAILGKENSRQHAYTKNPIVPNL